MAGSTIFSTLDMTAGYNQVPVKPEDIPKTAFVTKRGLYEFRTMSDQCTSHISKSRGARSAGAPMDFLSNLFK